MASDFVRNIKGIRNIDILSPNITTENDLISTIDGVVYVVTKKGYQRITPGDTEQDIGVLEKSVKKLKTQSDSNTLNISDNTDDIETNTSEIETLKTSTGNNTSEIETLKTSTGNNTSEIETLQTTTGNNTSEIETLQTTTGNNTTSIGELETKTSDNTTSIGTLETKTSDNTTSISELETKTSDNTTSIEGLETDFNNMFSDTGWQDLVLNSGIEKYNDSEPPQYKITKINNNTTISIRGSVKGITERNTVIANIPLNDDLIQKHPFSQVCTLKRNEKDELYPPMNRWEVNKNGDIELVYMGIPENDISGTEWCPISTQFDI